MRRVLLACLFAAAFSFLAMAPSHADGFDIPGLSSDATDYQSALASRFPAGGSPALRQQAEQQADAAIRKQDWAAAVTALETRAAAGDAGADIWTALARAQLRRTPPDAKHALDAAWIAFQNADAGAGEIPPLLLMAEALRMLGRPAQALLALEQVVERDPQNPTYAKMLAEARQSVGMAVRGVRAEAEAQPARACINFSVPPTRARDFHPQDWVTLSPQVADAAVTREGDRLCVSGLPWGATTRITLRAGLPGLDGVSLEKPVTLAVAMANRQPRVVIDQRLFVLPRGQAPKLSLGTINLSAVKLRLAQLSERNIVAFVRNNRLGQPVGSWEADRIAEDTGRVVWQGHADIPHWTVNQLAHTALPLPDALATAGPGLYALTISAGDGTPNARSATQMILRTDLAPTVWRGSDGLTIQVRGYSDAKPRAGVKLQLLASNNDILGEAETDANGVGHFGAPLLQGDGPMAPREVFALAPAADGHEADFTALDLDSPSFDLSDRGVAGRPSPGPLDSYVWLDRGIYRPGETVQVMALLRDAAGKPVDIPAHLIVRRPNGQVFLDTVPPRSGDASLYLPVHLSAGAPAGTWSVEVRADPAAPPIGRTEFRVDAFVPDRMAVDLGPVDGAIVPGKPFPVPVAARFLYGAPGAGLTGKATLRLVIDPAPFPALDGYTVGLANEPYAPDAQDLPLPTTDGQGRSTVIINVPRAPDTTHPLQAELDVAVDDPAGRASRATTTIKLRPSGPLIGIRPAFKGGAVDAGTEAGFDIIAVDPDGKPAKLDATLRLVRERPDWRLVMSGSLARYETVWRDEPLQTEAITIPAGSAFHFAKTLDFGRYRLEVTQKGGLAATSVHFRSGWVATDNPDVPDMVDVSADRATHKPGETARIHIAPPFAGEATLLVLTDRVQTLRDISVPAGGMDVEVPVSAEWGPGAYIAVHLFRPATDPARNRPQRAIGLTWVGIDPATRTLPVSFAAADLYRPRATATVTLRTAPGAWVSVAAVDEGILRLTRFAAPDPVPHFLGRRRLGVDIRDDWGRLIAPGEGEATALRQGGDEGSFVLPDIPVQTVTLFSPPRQAGPDGTLAVRLDLPDFAGQVRLMAVAWQDNRIGAANTDITVRDKLVAQTLLPRFLAPGDQARLAVLLHNLELSSGEVVATLSTDGPLAIDGPSRLAVTLAKGAQALPATTLKATGAGRGVVKLDVTGPDGFSVHHELAITVRPSRAPASVTAAAEVAPGAEARLAPPLDQFLPGTARAIVRFGGAVRFDPAAIVAALDDYPLNCLEQATSRGFPLTLLPDGPVAGPDRAGRLQRAVSSVLDRQRFDGGFALWSANGEAEPWLSAYATEFLLRARAAGAAVPQPALDDALKYVASTVDGGDQPPALAVEAYDLYVLALAGKGRPGAARVLAANPTRLPTPLARAQVAAALALAHDNPTAEALFAAALDAPARQDWGADYGSALRDQFAITVLLKESGLLPARQATLTAGLPGADLDPRMLNTQEQAWAAAAAAVLGRDGKPVRIALDGKTLPAAPVVTQLLDGPATARNLGDAPVWQSVSVTGVPATPLPAARNGMSIRRFFYNTDGSPLDLDHLTQNTVFVLVIEGRAEDGQAHRAMVLHGLPAGWEVAGRFGGGKAPGMNWLGDLTDTEAQPAADDRFAAVVQLTPDAPSFRVAVRLRAVTPGSYELPGAQVADMYRPAVFARQNTGRVGVLPAP
jgi:uncharacterized protein YfaS (alpha-2-macroglobulin family)